MWGSSGWAEKAHSNDWQEIHDFYDKDIEACEQKEKDDQKSFDLQKENEEWEAWNPTNLEIHGAADQLGGFGDMPGVIQQLQPELPNTSRVAHPIGNHNPPGSGAGAKRRAGKALAVAAGTTNPYQKEVKHAVKQLRSAQKQGKNAQILFIAKRKVRDYHEKAGLWDHHRQTNIEGNTFITPFAKKEIADAAEAFADGHAVWADYQEL